MSDSGDVSMVDNKNNIETEIRDIVSGVLKTTVKNTVIDILNVVENSHISGFSLGTKHKRGFRDKLIAEIRNRYAKYLD